MIIYSHIDMVASTTECNWKRELKGTIGEYYKWRIIAFALVKILMDIRRECAVARYKLM